MAAIAGHSRRRCRHASTLAYVATILAMAAASLSIAAGSVADGASQQEVDARIDNAWRVLRTVDCARCHGKDYAGLAAPSIVDFAASQNRETFIRMVLDGDPVRGMPGYRSNAYVVANVDDIYRYFRARASGDVGPEYRPLPSAERR